MCGALQVVCACVVCIGDTSRDDAGDSKAADTQEGKWWTPPGWVGHTGGWVGSGHKWRTAIQLTESPGDGMHSNMPIGDYLAMLPDVFDTYTYSKVSDSHGKVKSV